MAEPQIVQLAEADHAEALEVLAESFAGHPMVPPDKPGKPEHHNARLMMGTLLEVFAGRPGKPGAPGARLLGSRIDGELACVAFVHDYGFEPKGLDMARMAWQMLRVMGPRKLVGSIRVMSEKHPGDDRRLELLILGTRAQFQQRGLGRAMVRHISELAAQGGYAAVTLEAAKETPAFGFYEREGFVVEKERALHGQPLCWMRRDLASRDGASGAEKPEPTDDAAAGAAAV
ncbi:MAG: GNAT family N-acetyltransferase [Planctomycetota bacterium]